MNSYVQTASSCHGKCFICKRSSVKLKKVSEDSVVKAFTEHRIYIKDHARVCERHLKDGRLKEEEFNKIPTTLQPYGPRAYMLLNSVAKLATKPKLLFDHFEDMSQVTDEICLEATGWKKKTFKRFASYISSINETKGRSKEQLIAIYRYWIRKGVSQDSLARLKSNCTRIQMNKYLTVIRKAIYHDFVPYFLGANSRSREFFISHNNDSSKELFNLSEDHLAVVIDGTYARIEKSSNNKFQYDTWSGQKVDSLIKPFTVCCTDGYFIDCYGPFKANQNDATILKYILETEKHLLSILQPKKSTVFLDRGFRDVFSVLKQKPYYMNPQIPYIPGLEDKKKRKEGTEDEQKKSKQLTTEQANKNRLVTKIRFIIEKQNSLLKNMRALDSIRNTSVGHIQIDYRIACAMHNFKYKPCCPDGQNAIQVAKQIVKASKIKENKLAALLTKQLNTADFVQIELSDIEDFPKLEPDVICSRILLGTFQYRLSKSYVADLLEHGVAYSMSSKYISKITNKKLQQELNGNKSKIVAFEIASRHRRGVVKETKKLRVNYKVIIQYEPNNNNPESIKGELIF